MTYVIRETNGSDYLTFRGWAPASDQATEYETREEAEQAVEDECADRDVTIFERE